MAGITLQTAETTLAYFVGILTQLGINSEVTIDGTTFRRHQLPDIEKSITIWEKRVQKLTPASAGGSVRVRQGVPR